MVGLPTQGVGAQFGLFRDPAVRSALGIPEFEYYIKPDGDDDNDGSSWDEAFETFIKAASVLHNDAFDTVFVRPGDYDENTNAADGVLIDKNLVEFRGVSRGVNISNTDTTNGGSVFKITGQYVTLNNLVPWKRESTSTGSAAVRYVGAFSCLLIDFLIPVDAATHCGVSLEGVSDGIIMIASQPYLAGIFGLGFGGTGIDLVSTRNSALGNVAIGTLDTGLICRAGALVNSFDRDMIITNCAVGYELQPGAFGNILGMSTANCPIRGIDNSGNATNPTDPSITALKLDVSHIPAFPGTIFYVDPNGKNTNAGTTAETAFASINVAKAAMSNGDRVVVKKGLYDEEVDWNKDGTQLLCEPGVVLVNTTPGTPLTVSGENCVVHGIETDQPGQKGIVATGSGVELSRCRTRNATIGIETANGGCCLWRCRSFGASIDNFLNFGDDVELVDCDAVGNSPTSKGLHISGNATGVRARNFFSTGNGGAGFALDAGTSNCSIQGISGGGDGDVLDAGTNNMKSIVDIRPEENNETPVRFTDGEGNAPDPITVSNQATDDEPSSNTGADYWGNTYAYIAPGARTRAYRLTGTDLFSVTVNVFVFCQILGTNPSVAATRDGGNAWNYSETQLTINAIPTRMKIGQLWWIVSDAYPDGEIQRISAIDTENRIVTVERETNEAANTGLRYNHGSGSDPEMYLVVDDDDDEFSPYNVEYTSGAAKVPLNASLVDPKWVPPEGALIIRMTSDSNALAYVDINPRVCS